MEFPEVIERELTHPAAVEIGVEEKKVVVWEAQVPRAIHVLRVDPLSETWVVDSQAAKALL
jgi:hypothetical protein